MSSYSARKRRSSSKERAKQPIAFLGDTLVNKWADQGLEIWENLYAPLNAVNHATVNDSTQNLIEKLEREEIPLEGTRTAVVMIGATDLRFKLKEHVVLEQIRKIIQLLQQSSPGIKILLLGILPRWDKDVNVAIQETNELLSFVENGFTIRFLDMYPHFVDPDTGKIIDELYDNDGINLSAKGYQVWADSMARVLQDCLE